MTTLRILNHVIRNEEMADKNQNAFSPLFLDEKWSKNQGFEAFCIASLASPKFGRVISFVPQELPGLTKEQLLVSFEELLGRRSTMTRIR